MNINSSRWNLLLVLFFGFLGGMLSNYIFSPQLLEAYDRKTMQALLSDRFQLIDDENKVRVDFNNPRKKGFALNIYDENGKQRFQMGTDDGNDKITERQRPFFALFDEKEKTRIIFKLKGAQESPVVIFKDQLNNPRFEMGLDSTVIDELPFIKYYDIYGVEHKIFGEQAYK